MEYGDGGMEGWRDAECEVCVEEGDEVWRRGRRVSACTLCSLAGALGWLSVGDGGKGRGILGPWSLVLGVVDGVRLAASEWYGA